MAGWLAGWLVYVTDIVHTFLHSTAAGAVDTRAPLELATLELAMSGPRWSWPRQGHAGAGLRGPAGAGHVRAMLVLVSGPLLVLVSGAQLAQLPCQLLPGIP